MKRRAFLLLFGGVATAWPLTVRSATGKRSTIGFLLPGPQAAYATWADGFVQRMRELGWIESRHGGGEGSLPEIAAELVRLKVDVIVTSGSEAVLAARQISSTIPIVFAATSDPVASGLVASLARPGGNATGLSAQSTDYGSKSVGLLREAVPGLQRIAILTDPANPGARARP